MAGCWPIWCASARPPRSTVESRPHVGSNRLPKVLTALRAHLEALGVEYRFETEAAGLRASGGRVRAVRCGRGRAAADVVVLAVGHSARAVYECAAPTAWPDRAQGPGGGRAHRAPAAGDRRHPVRRGAPAIRALPPAFYELKAPGGGARRLQLLHVPGRLDRPRGHRARRRGGQRHEPVAARLALRQRRPGGGGRAADDFGPAAAGAAGRGGLPAADRAGGLPRRAAAPSAPPRSAWRDFLAGRASTSLPATSYRPGVVAGPHRGGVPAVRGRGAARGAGGAGPPPARLPAPRRRAGRRRDPHQRPGAHARAIRSTLESPRVAGLYPVGEGAGYAGGIVSAALDGARAAAAIIAVATPAG